ncbi:MAG: hypothetical protein RLZZ630_903 [Bacteroidota bacterium]|jgi:exodeoxyribonuclease VII large subunit
MENDSGVLKLSQLSAIVAGVFQMHFSEERFWVTAEIVGMKLSRGHCYLQLAEKDENGATPKAEFRGNIWSFQYERISQRFFRITGSPLREQIQVLLCVEVKYHERYGLSLIVHDIDPAFTLGHLELEKRKTIEKLKQEGLYDRNRELELPAGLQRIALISAEDSRGYEDFMNRLNTNPYGYAFDVTLYNSLLQGDLAAGSIIAQLQQIKTDRLLKGFDAVALVRGGGATSGMECFNNYLLAEAIATFSLPVITGIGHHADSNVCDEVAHTKRMTPTDVANFFIEHQQEFEGTILSYWEQVRDIAEQTVQDEHQFVKEASIRLHQQVQRTVSRSGRQLDQAAFALKHRMQKSLLEEQATIRRLQEHLRKESRLQTQLERGYFDEQSDGLTRQTAAILHREEAGLDTTASAVRLLDPELVLRRGYSYSLVEGTLLSSITDARSGDTLTTVLKDGTIQSKII